MSLTNEHAATLFVPDTDLITSTRSKGRGKIQGIECPENISVIWVEQESGIKAQSIRFPKKEFTAEQAQEWLKKNKIKHTNFESAREKGEPCYTHFIDKAKKSIDIIMHDVIGFEGSQSKDFMNLLSDKTISSINIDINSPGGNVTDGLSIYNTLKAHPANVHVKISGVAASMASVIAMAGDEIEMPETSLMMIHKPLVPFLMAANADKLRQTAETLDVMESSITKAYNKRMNLGEDAISVLMRDITWFSAAKAKEAGLADIITEEAVKVDNYHDFSAFDYHDSVPDVVMNLYSVDANQDIDEDKIEEPLSESLIAKLSKFFQPLKTIPIVKELDMTEERELQLVSENDALKAEVATLKSQVGAVDLEKKTTAYTAFCDTLVSEGKIRPVDVEIHTQTLLSKASDEDVASYQNWLKTLPVVVDISKKPVANKADVSDKTIEDKFAEEVKNIMNEKKISYAAALREAYNKNPELYSAE